MAAKRSVDDICEAWTMIKCDNIVMKKKEVIMMLKSGASIMDMAHTFDV